MIKDDTTDLGNLLTVDERSRYKAFRYPEKYGPRRKPRIRTIVRVTTLDGKHGHEIELDINVPREAVARRIAMIERAAS